MKLARRITLGLITTSLLLCSSMAMAADDYVRDVNVTEVKLNNSGTNYLEITLSDDKSSGCDRIRWTTTEIDYEMLKLYMSLAMSMKLSGIKGDVGYLVGSARNGTCQGRMIRIEN